MSRSFWVSVSWVFLLSLFRHDFASALPSGFIAEVVTDEIRAIKGIFAPNPRNDGWPMLLLLSKQGQISALENPDESPEPTLIVDLADYICTDQERGLHNLLVMEQEEAHAFNGTNGTVVTTTRYVVYAYIYYTTNDGGCEEPWNVLDRFIMDRNTLQLDYESRKEIWR